MKAGKCVCSISAAQAKSEGFKCPDINVFDISDKNGNNFWTSLLCCDHHHKGWVFHVYCV